MNELQTIIAAASALNSRAETAEKRVAELEAKLAAEQPPAPASSPTPTPPAAPDDGYDDDGYATIAVDPTNFLDKLNNARSKTQFVFADGDYPLTKSLILKCSDIELVARKAGKAKFLDADPAANDTQARAAFEIYSGINNITVDGFVFDSPDAWGKQMNGVNVSGDNVVIRNCDFRRIYQGVYITSKAKDVDVTDCRFASAYGVYVTGTDVLVSECVADKCSLAFIRAAGFKNLAIDCNKIVGDAQATKSEPSHVTIQKGDSCAIANNVFIDTGISVRPLTNVNGLRDEKTVAAFKMVRTSNVKIFGNIMNGLRSKVLIGARTENVDYKGDESRVKLELKDKIIADASVSTIVPIGTIIDLPPASGVWINGRKVA